MCYKKLDIFVYRFVVATYRMVFLVLSKYYHLTLE